MGILSVFKGKGNVLYYPGCLTKFVLQSEMNNYRKILNKIGVDFIMLPDEMHLCCGSPVRNAGYEKDARQLARKNFELFKKHSIGKIITNCPACFKTFMQDYKEMMHDWNIEVEHITKTILNALKKRPQLVIKKGEGIVTYHDPCHLGRHSGSYEAPREILKLIGYEIVEMKHHHENALCCGGGAGLKANNPELANRIAKKRIKEAEEVEAKKIITACPLCFAHIDENSGFEPVGVIEFSYAVADALGLKPEKTEIEKIHMVDEEVCS